MKKTLALALSLVLALALLTGCSSAEFTLGEYKGVEVTVAKNTVEDSEVEDFMLYLYQSGVTEEEMITNRPVELGDTAVIDYEGKLDGVAFEGGTASGYELGIGTGTFIEGFEEGLVGVMPGETVDLNLTFPENYTSTELAGEEVVFTVTVHSVYPNASEMKDSVVAGFGNANYASLDELRQYSVEYLENYNEMEYQSNVQTAVLETVMSNAFFEKIPDKKVQESVDRITQTYSSYATSYGVDVDTMVYYMTGTDVQTLANEYVMQTLALQEIAKREGIKVTDEEVTEALNTEAGYYGYDPDAYLEMIGEDYFKETLLAQKVVEFLAENAVVVSE